MQPTAVACTKFAPFTVSVKSGAPTIRDRGLIEVMDGGLTMNVWRAESSDSELIWLRSETWPSRWRPRLWTGP